jgi:hypothetical protein
MPQSSCSRAQWPTLLAATSRCTEAHRQRCQDALRLTGSDAKMHTGTQVAMPRCTEAHRQRCQDALRHTGTQAHTPPEDLQARPGRRRGCWRPPGGGGQLAQVEAHVLVAEPGRKHLLLPMGAWKQLAGQSEKRNCCMCTQGRRRRQVGGLAAAAARLVGQPRALAAPAHLHCECRGNMTSLPVRRGVCCTLEARHQAVLDGPWGCLHIPQGFRRPPPRRISAWAFVPAACAAQQAP